MNSLSYLAVRKIQTMKNSVLIFSVFILLVQISCSKIPETKVEDQSIESAEDGKVLIRLKPQVGDVQKMMVTMDLNSMGKQEMKSNIRLNMDMKVTAKDADVYTYQVNYGSLKAKMNMGAMEINYDSDEKEHTGAGAYIHQSMQKLLENPMEMKMNDRGEISEFKMPTETGNEQMNNMSSFSIPLPKEAVGIGDSWSSVRHIENFGDLKMTMEVEKITVDDVVIKTNGNISNGTDETLGTFDGNYTLRRDNGLTKEGTINMNLASTENPMKMTLNFKSL
jgi:hypothetical protein